MTTKAIRRARRIFRVIFVLGALLIYGTAGASDAGDISFARTVIQSGIGTLMFVSGAWLGGLMRWLW